MEEVIEPAPLEDTILAASTPPGHGALGIVRVSGPETLALLARHCQAKVPSQKSIPSNELFVNRPRQAIYCDISDGRGAYLDEAVVTFYPGPNSYTGEDTAEISLHGNPLLLRKFILAAAEFPALRLAEAGEFTRRAFLNGKMDLTRAEAVRRVIEARGEFELQAGQKILSGDLARMVSRFRSHLVSLKAETEAEVDFSTEDLTFESKQERIKRTQALIEEVRSILKRSETTARLAQGFQIALAGAPNAGKSSLLNLMLGWERAIVSAVPGTTRDYVAEEIHIDGISLRIVDTAGLRQTGDSIEAEGVRRSKKEIDKSQIVLHVIDGSSSPYELAELERTDRMIPVVNKSDVLDSAWREKRATSINDDEANEVFLSCKESTGLEDLKAAIRKLMYADTTPGDPLLLEDRHRTHFSRILDALEKVIGLWGQGAPEEIVALEIDRALEHTGEITGHVSNEEILGRIFSMFCVGK